MSPHQLWFGRGLRLSIDSHTFDVIQRVLVLRVPIATPEKAKCEKKSEREREREVPNEMTGKKMRGEEMK